MKNPFKRIWQRKPFRVYIWQTISATLLIIPSVIAIYESQLPPYLLGLLVPLYGLIDAGLKYINTEKLGDYGVIKNGK